MGVAPDDGIARLRVLILRRSEGANLPR